jgi:choline dehydrogenase
MANKHSSKRADYVIVGIGTAGCLLARKLSDNHDFSVIGIEAGLNNIDTVPIKNSVYTGVQYGLPNNYYPEYFYAQKPVLNGSLTYNEDPIKTNHINGSDIPIVQNETTIGDYTTGRILGGGSSINGEQYVRGTSAYYDEWATAVADNRWSATSADHVFKELEDYLGSTPNPSVHGYKGHLHIRQAPVIPTTMATKFSQAVTNALGYVGIPDDDYNNPATPLGPFTRWELFQNPNTTRCSAATAFLGPSVMTKEGHGVHGRKLEIIFKATANKIIWKKNKAVGVRVIVNGESKNIYANLKVIVCLGIHSAEFLQRSGVGPKSLLDELKIKTIYNNPNVGKNWSNQTLVPVVFSANPNDPALPANDLAALYTGGAFLPPLLPQSDPALRGFQLIGAGSTGQFDMIVIDLQPHSLGTIRIQSSDPFQVSLVDNNYMNDPDGFDLQSYVLAFQNYVQPIATALHSIDSQYQLIAPTAFDTPTLQDYIISNFNHTHHWRGSNRMTKTASDGVVDSTGHVFGVKNLVICDNSVIPIMSDGNTCAPVYMTALTIAKHLIKIAKKK